jgi:hypothetical protein
MIEINGGPPQLDGNDPITAAEAARRDAAASHAAGFQCAECGAAAAVDRTWVRVCHRVTCPRRRTATARRPRPRVHCTATMTSVWLPDRPSRDDEPASAPEESAPPKPAGEQPPDPASPTGRQRHENRRTRCRSGRRLGRRPWRGSYVARPRTGVRAGVVAAWFVGGARVLVRGFAATARRICRQAGRLVVWVDFDDGWPAGAYSIFELTAEGWPEC